MILETAVDAARAGGEVLRQRFRDSTLAVRAKGRHDFVTEADHESEDRVLGVIRRTFPDHHVLAEESGVVEGTGAEHEWVVDPLDGTSNFMQGVPLFCVSVACRERGRTVAGVVYDPLRDDLFTARAGQGAEWNGEPIRVSDSPDLEGAFLATGYPFKALRALDLYLTGFREIFRKARGIRRCGSAALDLAYTAAGVYDGFFEFRLSPWDYAAGALLIHEAGGRVTDLDGGEEWFRSGNLLAGGVGVHRDLLETLRPIVDEELLEQAEPRVPVGS